MLGFTNGLKDSKAYEIHNKDLNRVLRNFKRLGFKIGKRSSGPTYTDVEIINTGDFTQWAKAKQAYKNQ